MGLHGRLCDLHSRPSDKFYMALDEMLCEIRAGSKISTFELPVYIVYLLELIKSYNEHDQDDPSVVIGEPSVVVYGSNKELIYFRMSERTQDEINEINLKIHETLPQADRIVINYLVYKVTDNLFVEINRGFSYIR